MRYGIKLIHTIADMSYPDTLRQMDLISSWSSNAVNTHKIHKLNNILTRTNQPASMHTSTGINSHKNYQT